MAEPSDHLLRTFGTIPYESRVLDLGCGQGTDTDPLIRLGFDVYACDTSPEAVGDLRSRVAEPAIPEGQVAVSDRGYAGDSGLEPTLTPRTLNELLPDANFSVAERPSIAWQGKERVVQAIYRRVEPDTPG